MARERAFSDNQVVDAANALLVEGKNINGTSLRNKIGTGRPSALMAAYNKLKEDGDILVPSVPDLSEQTIVHQELPPEVAEMMSIMLGDVERLIHQINDHAHYTVEQRLNKAIAEANERAASAAKREAESIQEQDKAFEQLEDAFEEINELREQLATSQQEINQLNTTLNVAHSETKSALDTIDERDVRLTELQEQMKVMQQQLNQAGSDKAKAQGQVELQRTQLSEQSEELKVMSNNFSQLQKTQAKSENQIESLTNQLASLLQQNETQKTDSKQLQSQFDEEKSAHIRSQSRIETLNEEMDKKDKTLTETLASLNEAQKVSARLEGQLLQYQQSTNNKKND
ncbi:DNA-binding protein [Aliivibrio fischeri]|uniref:DNA-binding protein n=1 Tax=Aliivibrio fischeri TaxID=668 RepID=UPI00080E811D|nr:DNA-binding protein [Aliivibrio fischeri]OCH37814.1 hypothetical protein A6E02_18355 [Aliivibrio fischeri]